MNVSELHQEEARRRAETIDYARQFLLGSLIKAATARFRAQVLPWGSLKKTEQETLLQDIQDDIYDAVRDAVEIIASDDRTTFRAICKTVAFTEEGVKAQLSMANTESAHALADAAGKTILVVIEDGGRYLEVGDATDAEDDQRPLFGSAKA